MSKRRKRSFRNVPLTTTLFLDLLRDSRARPIFIYIALFVAICGALFHWLEGWSWLDSFYFVFVTFTTIGYGDFTPTMPITKLLTIFIGLNGVALLLTLFDEIRRLRHQGYIEEPAAEAKSAT